MKIESREVLEVTLPRHRFRRHEWLRHAVEVDERGDAIRVLCDRVELDNLAHDCTENRNDPPTCRICLRKLNKLK